MRGRRPLDAADLDVGGGGAARGRSRARRPWRRPWSCCGRGADRSRAAGKPRCATSSASEVRRRPRLPAVRASLLAEAVGRLRGRRERSGQDHDHGQAGPGLDARGQDAASSARPTPFAPRRPSSSRSGPKRSGSRLPPRRRRGRSLVGAHRRPAHGPARGPMTRCVVDTAGRLHTKGNLMAELEKMARVAGKEMPGAPHETLLVLDATVGEQRPRPGPRVHARRRPSPASCSPSSTEPPRAEWRWPSCASSACPSATSGSGETAEDLLPFDAAAFAGEPGRVRLDRGRRGLRLMRRALASRGAGLGETNPNPLVGCVIVRAGRVVGEGFHAAGRWPARGGGRARPRGVAGAGSDPLRDPRAVRASRQAHTAVCPGGGGRGPRARRGGHARSQPAR